MFDKWIFPNNWQIWVVALCSVMHQRSAWRLAVIFAGIIFAKGRKTVTSWFRAAGISQQYKAFYYFISSISQSKIGRNTHRQPKNKMTAKLLEIKPPRTANGYNIGKL